MQAITFYAKKFQVAWAKLKQWARPFQDVLTNDYGSHRGGLEDQPTFFHSERVVQARPFYLKIIKAMEKALTLLLVLFPFVSTMLASAGPEIYSIMKRKFTTFKEWQNENRRRYLRYRRQTMRI